MAEEKLPQNVEDFILAMQNEVKIAIKKMSALSNAETATDDVDAIQNDFNKGIDAVVERFSKMPGMDDLNNDENMAKIVQERLAPCMEEFQKVAEQKVSELIKGITDDAKKQINNMK